MSISQSLDGRTTKGASRAFSTFAIFAIYTLKPRRPGPSRT
jgi:hypothetical protein